MAYEVLLLPSSSWLPPCSLPLLWPHWLPCSLHTPSTDPPRSCGFAVSSAWRFSLGWLLHCFLFFSQFHLLRAGFPKLVTYKGLPCHSPFPNCALFFLLRSYLCLNLCWFPWLPISPLYHKLHMCLYLLCLVHHSIPSIQNSASYIKGTQ